MSNSVPKGWEATSLRELCKFSGGSAFKEKYQGRRTGDYPFIKVSDMNIDGNQRFIINANHWIDQATKVEAKVKLFPTSAVVFAKVGAALLLNRRRILTRDTAIDNNMMAAIPNSDDNNFLYYVLQEVDLGEIVQGGAVPSVNQAQMEDVPALIPPLPEQQKIATILSSVDNVIETTRAQIDKLKDLKTGMMQELLTKGIGVDGVPHSEFKDSPVGRIPASWDIHSAQELLSKKILLKLQDGNHGSQYPRSSEFEKFGVPYIAASHISEFGEIDFAHCPHLSQARAGQLRIQPAQSGDVILTHNATVGRTAIIPSNKKEIIASTSTTYYRTNPSKLLNRYLFFYFQSTAFFSQLQSIMGQTTRNQVPITAQRELQIVLPSIDEQLAIAEIIESVAKRLKILRTKLERLQFEKKALMQDLLTGKVRVNIEEKEKEPVVA